MKTITKAVSLSIKLMCGPLLLFALVACGKSGDSNNNVAAVQYGIQYGQCYDITHNTVAPSQTYCSGSNGYTYSGTQCIQTSTGQAVDPTLCQQSLYGGGYGGGYNGGYGNGYPSGYGYGGGATYYPYGQGYAAAFGANYYPNTYGGGAYSGSQQCIGQYYQTSGTGFSAQLMTCGYGGACSGLFLYSQATRQRVLCL